MNKIIVSGVLLILLILSSTFYWLHSHMTQQLDIVEPQLVTIERGTTVLTALDKVSHKGKLNTFAVQLWLKMNPEMAKIKSGTYRIDSQHSYASLLALFVSGKEHLFTMTFIEGSTFNDWLNKIAASPNIVHSLAGLSVADIAEKLSISKENPEGLFFPDTYAFSYGETDLAILKRAQYKMSQVLSDAWQNRPSNLPYKNEYEALIMASIIEKETAVRSEMPRISSVFVNRLNKGMRLQTDPTIIYGLGNRYTGDITYANIREKTAYNTYRIDGLPPTPIAMPGKDAIEATFAPDKTEYLYFVANGEGEHIFSTNLADHNRAVKKYQLGKN